MYDLCNLPRNQIIIGRLRLSHPNRRGSSQYHEDSKKRNPHLDSAFFYKFRRKTKSSSVIWM
jgi:hypothetical protein